MHRNKHREKGDSGQKNFAFDAVIETPKGSRNKFKLDQRLRAFRLSKVMPQGMIFPFDFGFMPGTQADDGDPLDILVLMDDPTFPGCVVECLLIGVVEAEQKEGGETHRNDRLLAVAKASEMYADVRDIADLNPHTLKQIEGFFVNYQALREVRVRILGRKGPEAAKKMLESKRLRAA